MDGSGFYLCENPPASPDATHHPVGVDGGGDPFQRITEGVVRDHPVDDPDFVIFLQKRKYFLRDR